MNIKEILNKAKNNELIFEKNSLDIEYDTYEEFEQHLLNLDKENKISKFELIYNIISTPILIIHELFHIIFGIIVGREIENVNISKINSTFFHASVEFKKPFADSFFKSFFVNLAPLSILIISISLLFVNILFIWLLVYILFTYKFSFPSKVDFFKVLLFKYKKDLPDENKYLNFGSYCVNNFTIFDLLTQKKED